jgi:tellurite resistance protein TerC
MLLLWIGFITLILALLALDLGVFNRRPHAISVKEALSWSSLWIAIALGFSVFVYFGYENHWQGLGTHVDAVDQSINDGRSAVLKYLTGYVVEKSLSVDNIFVIALIFSAFAIPAMYQHRVLFWGIVGALVLRGAMIGAGSTLIAHFHWILYIFGAFLILTAIKMLTLKAGHNDPGSSPIVRLTRRVFPISDQLHGHHFIARDSGRTMLTPLALSLIVVETTDVIFAVDSIPAIFAITADPFLVFTSNVFAVLGLRSLYFALAGAIDKFRYLKLSLAIVLAMVGVKMLAANWLKLWIGPSFMMWTPGLIIAILAAGVIASLIADRHDSSSPADATSFFKSASRRIAHAARKRIGS